MDDDEIPEWEFDYERILEEEFMIFEEEGG